MLSSQEQIKRSGAVAAQLMSLDASFDPLEAWHTGIEAVRLHSDDTTRTEEFIELSTISYRAVGYGAGLLAELQVTNPLSIIENSSDAMIDLTKNHQNQTRRCGGYLLSAPSLQPGVPILELREDKLQVPEVIASTLEPSPAFDSPELLPEFWRVATSLVFDINQSRLETFVKL